MFCNYDDQSMWIDEETNEYIKWKCNCGATRTIDKEHVKQPKPPLGVMPRDIYELQRVQELTRALYEYYTYEEMDLELMIKWSDELHDRLFSLTLED